MVSDVADRAFTGNRTPLPRRRSAPGTAILARMAKTPPSLAVVGSEHPSSARESLIQYPSAFPIKVMGSRADGFVGAVTEIVRRFDPEFDASTVELRPSRQGHYLAVTVTVTATSREQLDGLYRALTSHPMVKVVL